MSLDAIIGFALGLLSSLLSGVVLFWLQGRRDVQREAMKQRREDTRIARNWAQDGKKTSLRGYDLVGANLSGKDLAGADLEDCNLADTKLWETNFSSANLIRASFQNAKLREVKFNGAKLIFTDFDGADLRRVDFTGANLHRTKLGNVKNIEGCIWTDVKIDETTELSSGLQKMIQEQLSQKATSLGEVRDAISSASPQSQIR